MTTWVITLVKNSGIEIPKQHAHLHIKRSKTTKFQMNPMKDVRGLAKTRSWMAEQMERQKESCTHGPTRIISIAPSPLSGDKKP